jgi:hypothetical protein
MSKQAINHTIAQINEFLFASIPGSGSTIDRSKARNKANELVVTLPSKWWNKANTDLVQQFQALSAI